MRSSKFLSHMSACMVVLFLGFGATAAQADSATVKWKRIVGVIVPGTSFFERLNRLNVVADVQNVPLSWTATRGKAKVNLESGKVTFFVEGLVLTAAPLFTSTVIGVPSPLVTMVKGTVVCNSTGAVELVDTAAVPLSAQGDAEFHGEVALPPVCANVAFLIRVVDSNILFDRWIAHGAVRKP